METLRYEESLDNNATIMYAKAYYAVLDYEEGLYHVAFLEGEARQRFKKWVKEFVTKKKKFPDDP